MAFWSRKKAPVKETGPAPLVPDNASWHEWEAAGRKLLEEGDTVRAVEHLVQAVDRFDANTAELGRFTSRVAESAMKLAVLLATKEKAYPVYLLANVDEEIRVKFPGYVPARTLTDVITDECDSKISGICTPGEVVMLTTCALYACLGYIVHSADIRDDLMRCARASEICVRASELVNGMKKGSGHTPPREAAVFLEIYSKYCDSLKAAINRSTADMSEDDLDQLAAYRAEHPADSIRYVFEGLDAANHTAVRISSKKKAYEEKWLENVRLFADQKVSFDE